MGFAYSPANVLIMPGDTVHWQGDFTMHPLVSDEGLWQTANSGSDFEHTFDQPGIYHYHCFFHNQLGMNGSVTVAYLNFLPLIVK